jgi:hypothetical protein
VLVDAGVALEGLHEDVEVVGVGDVADFAQPHLHVLDIDARRVPVAAEVLPRVLHHEAGRHHVALPVPPVERLQVVVELLLARPHELVLVDPFPRTQVPQSPENPVLLASRLLVHVLPLLRFELWSLNLHRWPRSHQTIY